MNDQQPRKPFVKPKKVGGGMLFKNFSKRKMEHPDGNGWVEINGVKYDVSAWIKPLKTGKGTFYSLSITEQRPKSNGLPPAEPQPGDESHTGNAEPAPHATEQPTTEPQEKEYVV